MNTTHIRKIIRILRGAKPAFCTAIVPAAGSSSRFGADDKLLSDLGGAPVLIRTLEALERTPEIAKIVIASGADAVNSVRALAAAHHIAKLHAVVPGGATRADSVRAALAALPKDTTLVAVHDAARPLATPDLIGRVVRCAERTGAAIPVVPVKDTIKLVAQGIVTATPDRSTLHAAQTPQVFSKLILGTALSLPGSFTDDASAVETMGVCVHALLGEYENLKITTREDLLLARLIYERRPPCASDTATTSTE
ncbi:MAG: 2-C-methyl-D-erythritol 4-phosphate cytidylyltransferase [Clostridiaceae bacterium]|nr:2-C-methyl-D-erythritol 4-phosphate cytidylyltransferase [Clostridiaceae bacterium]